MARIDNLTHFLEDIATSIKNKKSYSEDIKIPASEFDVEIAKMDTVKNQNKTVKDNGLVTPDEGYTGLGQVIVDVPKGQDTSDATATAADILKDKTAYAGGQKIVGTYEGGSGVGDVKLFETVDEMQADVDAKEGDLAVVYRSEMQNAQEGMTSSSVYLPSTVVLPAAFTDMVWLGLMTEDYSVEMRFELYENEANLSIYRMDGDSVRVNWSTTDYITWTSTSEQCDQSIDLGVDLLFENKYEEWNDVIGYFVQIGGKTFEGLYEYALEQPFVNRFQVFPLDASKYIYTMSSPEGFKESGFYIGEDIYTTDEIGAKIRSIDKTLSTWPRSVMLLSADMTKLHVYSEYWMFLYYKDGWFWLDNNTYSTAIEHRVYDLATMEYETSDILPSQQTIGSGTRWMAKLPDEQFLLVGLGGQDTQAITLRYLLAPGNTTWVGCELKTYQYTQSSDRYVYASNQLNLASTNELLPGKSGYGKNGVVVGDGSIYNNLDVNKLNANYNFSLADYIIQSAYDVKQLKGKNSISYDIDFDNPNYYVRFEEQIPSWWKDYSGWNEYIEVTVQTDDYKFIVITRFGNYLRVYEFDYENKTTNKKGEFLLDDMTLDGSYGGGGFDTTNMMFYFLVGKYNSSTDKIRYHMRRLRLDTMRVEEVFDKSYSRSTWSIMNTFCGFDFANNCFYTYDNKAKAIYRMSFSLTSTLVISNVTASTANLYTSFRISNLSNRYFCYTKENKIHIYDMRTNTVLDKSYPTTNEQQSFNSMKDVGKYTVFCISKDSGIPSIVLDSESNTEVATYQLRGTVSCVGFPNYNARVLDDDYIVLYTALLRLSDMTKCENSYIGNSMECMMKHNGFGFEGLSYNRCTTIYPVTVDTENDGLSHLAVYGDSEIAGTGYRIRNSDIEYFKNKEF